MNDVIKQIASRTPDVYGLMEQAIIALCQRAVSQEKSDIENDECVCDGCHDRQMTEDKLRQRIDLLTADLFIKDEECERLRTIFRELSEYHGESPFKTQQYLTAAADNVGAHTGRGAGGRIRAELVIERAKAKAAAGGEG
jgi:hypothetical protein